MLILASFLYNATQFLELYMQVVGKTEYDAKSRGRSVHIAFLRKVKKRRRRKKYIFIISMGVHRYEKLIL